MKEFVFRAETLVPAKLAEVFHFFADAENLETLTPPWLKFRVISSRPIKMQAGTLIDYKLRLRGWPMKWRSQITIWEPPRRFVDEQVRGPYQQWIHEHTFQERGDATLCRDYVRYAMWGGALVNALLVRRDIETIFAYRKMKLREIFGAA